MVMDFSAGGVLEQVDLNNMLMALNGGGVLDGLSVVERASPSMSVAVSIGNAHISNTKYTNSGSHNLGIGASHATLYRKDLVTWDPTSGIPVVTQGTNHAGGDSDPIYPPAMPSGDILLAIVDVDPTVTEIYTADINDKRIIVPGNVWEIIADADTKLAEELTEDTTTSVTYVKATNKEITIPSSVCYEAIELYISWQMKHSDSTGSSESKIYKNGVAVGAEKTRSTTSYATFTDTLSGWSGGDKIQIYQKTSSGDTCYVDTFRIYGAYIKPW